MGQPPAPRHDATVTDFAVAVWRIDNPPGIQCLQLWGGRLGVQIVQLRGFKIAFFEETRKQKAKQQRNWLIGV